MPPSLLEELERPAMSAIVHSAPLRVGNPDAFLRGLDDGAVPLLTFLQRPVGLDARRDVAQVDHDPSDLRILDPVAQPRVDPSHPAVGVEVPVDE